MFNCERCKQKLWTTYKKLPDGTVICNDCYSFHLTQILDKINDKQAYEIIYNFVEKYPGKYPHDLVMELVRLLEVKYHITIDVFTFKDILKLIHDKIEKENSLIKLAKLERELKREPGKANCCEVCNVEMPPSEYEYSMENFGKPLCLTHQREKRASPHALNLYEALKKRNVFCMLEPYGGPKHVDITIKDAKLYVGLDGEHHSLDPDQLLTDLTIDAESFKEGFATKRYTLHEIDHNLDEIADALAEVVKKRIKHIQQEDFVKSKSTKTSKTTAKHKHSEHKEPSLQVIK